MTDRDGEEPSVLFAKLVRLLADDAKRENEKKKAQSQGESQSASSFFVAGQSTTPSRTMNVQNGPDFVLCEWLQDFHGSPIWSFTNQKDTNGKVIRYYSDFMAGITRTMVHKQDLMDARATRLWKVIL